MDVAQPSNFTLQRPGRLALLAPRPQSVVLGIKGEFFMNWNAVGAIANLLGAAGVIASLIYLGIQIRQNTRTERSRAFQQIFASFTAQNLDMFGPQNIDVVISGMQDFNGLCGRDKLRFDHLMMGYFNALEATIVSKTAFLLGDETVENWAYALRTRFLPYPGVRDWWNDAKPIFSLETRAWVDKQISATNTESDYLGIKRAPA